MGLLSRVEYRADSKKHSPEGDATLDEMGKTLLERIKRLPEDVNTPYTALSHLKAYTNFRSAICLSLNGGLYSSYISLGAGIDKLSIPQDKVWSKENALLKYFRLDLNASDDFDYWIFPLDSSETEPWKAVLILEEENIGGQNTAFNPGAVSAIISEIPDKLFQQADGTEPEELEEIAPAELAPEDVMPEDVMPEELLDEEPLSAELETIKKKIVQFQKTHGIFSCVVLDGSNEDYIDFSRKVSEMVNALGLVIPLSPARPLILFPKSIDCELIIHRLSGSLNTEPLSTFETNNAEFALSRIQSFIENGSGKDQVITFQI